MYLLDTNHCSLILEEDPHVKQNLEQNPDLCTCVIVQGELIFMCEKSESKKNNLNKIHQFLSELQIHNIDDSIAKIYGNIKASLFEKFGPKDKKQKRQFKLEKNIGVSDHDIWIASIAIHHNLTILTEDKDFKRIKEVVENLQTDSWIQKNYH